MSGRLGFRTIAWLPCVSSSFELVFESRSPGTSKSRRKLTRTAGDDIQNDWGSYLLEFWNCQHFACILAHLVVGTERSAQQARSLLRKRTEGPGLMARGAAWAGTAAAVGIATGGVGWGLAAGWTAVTAIVALDRTKTDGRRETIQQLMRRYPLLRQVLWPLPKDFS